MPKTASKRSDKYVAKTFFSDAETSSFQNSGSNGTRSRTTNPRNVVGDQGLQYLEQKGRGTIGPSHKQMTPTQRKESAAKAKSTVDTAMDEAIEMVKKKKTASRSAY